MAETPCCAMHPVPGRGHLLDVKRHGRTGERACLWCGKRESDWPAPAAPSVGEPEPDTWYCTAERSHGRCNSPNDVGDETCGACGADRPPPLASLWGTSPDARRATPAEMIASLLAGCAALRSSLEEARKDTRRLEWLMMEDRRPWTRDEIDANLEDRA